jgi:hypothetical protein
VLPPEHPPHGRTLMRDYSGYFIRVGADEMVITARLNRKMKCPGCMWGVDRCPRCPVGVGKCWGCANPADYKLISQLESTLSCQACCDEMFARGMLLPPPTSVEPRPSPPGAPRPTAHV